MVQSITDKRKGGWVSVAAPNNGSDGRMALPRVAPVSTRENSRRCIEFFLYFMPKLLFKSSPHN